MIMKDEVCTITVHFPQQSFERFVFKIQYNTAISSSAAIEGFFSAGKDILKPRRSGSLRRTFPNAFVFERQLRVKVFQ